MYDSIQLFFDALRPCRESQMLAEFMQIGSGERVLDVGCGTGYLSLSAAWSQPLCGEIVGIDIEADLIERANENRERLGEVLPAPLPPGRFFTVDARKPIPGECHFDVVVSNPPFFAAHASRSSQDHPRRIARQDETLSTQDFFACAKRNLREGGRFYLVFPALRYEEIREEARNRDFTISQNEIDESVRKRSGGVCLIAGIYNPKSCLALS
jgi:tRNA1Val (adenine37-N6)-methyltransferase